MNPSDVGVVRAELLIAARGLFPFCLVESAAGNPRNLASLELIMRAIERGTDAEIREFAERIAADLVALAGLVGTAGRA